MAAEHRYDEQMDAQLARPFSQRGPVPLPETLGGLLERMAAQVSDIRRLYELATELDVRITGHQVPPSGTETTSPKVVREGFIDQATERLNEFQGLISGAEARLRNLAEKALT